MTPPADAYRMAYAYWQDGSDDRWHQPWAAQHGADAPAILTALRRGQRQAKADDYAYCLTHPTPTRPNP